MKSKIMFAALALAGYFAASACSEQTAVKTQAMQGKDVAHGIGVVNSLDLEARKINLTHEAIPEIGWSAMTMDFAVGETLDLSTLKKGDNVHFALKRDSDGAYRIAMACRIEGDVAAYKTAMKKMNEGGQGEAMPMTGEETHEGMIMPCMKGAANKDAHDETHH